MKNYHLYAKLSMLVALASIPSFYSNAATVTGTLGVTAIVGAGCQVNNANALQGLLILDHLTLAALILSEHKTSMHKRPAVVVAAL